MTNEQDVLGLLETLRKENYILAVQGGRFRAKVRGCENYHISDILNRLPLNLKQKVVAHIQREADRPVEMTAKDWDTLLHTWTQERCAWRERSYGATSGLYVSFCVWCAANDKPMLGTLQAFEETLRHLGFDVADSFAYGLILDEDAQASDSRPPANDFERLVSPEASALDCRFKLPSRTAQTERKTHVAR